jgi:hypothetical protein
MPKPPPKTTVVVKPVTKPPVSALDTSAFNNAVKAWKDSIPFRNVAKLVYHNALDLLIETPIHQYEVNGGVVVLYLPSGTVFPHAGGQLNKFHWILGLGNGVNQLTDADVTQDPASTNWSIVRLTPGGTTNTSIKTVTGGKIYSCRNFNTYGLNFGTADWQAYLDREGYKGVVSNFPFYDQLPIWSGSSIDEVHWTQRLSVYYTKLEQYTADKYKEMVAAYNKLIDDERQRGWATKDLTQLPTDNSTKSPGGNGNGKDNKVKDPGSNQGYLGIGDDSKPVIHNLPGVNEMYFRAWDPAGGDASKSVTYVTAGNKPSLVTDASKLWADNQAYKGMIQSYIVPAKLGAGAWNKPQDTGTGGLGVNIKNINSRRYGFQFIYNPSTVTMYYAGAPAVDIGLETSGADKVALIGSGVTSSTVTFSLLINRMNDFKYLDGLLQQYTDAAVQKTLAAVDREPVTGGPSFSDIYSHNGNHPQAHDNADNIDSVAEELQKIQKLGTMYDIEYLLMTLIGYRLPSSMRGNMLTADIGYLGAYPVELHLGKNLRYLVTIDSFNISHTIFTKDMVPVFTNLQLTCNRLPDFAKKSTLDNIKTQPSTSSTSSTTTGTN